MMKITTATMMSLLAASMLGNLAFANEVEDKAAGIECMPAKEFVKLLRKLDKLDASKKDTVGMTPVMSFEATDGGALPSRVFFRHGGAETPFHINADGLVPDFTNVKNMDKKGEMCLQDKTRIGIPEDENGLELEIEMDLLYHNKTGVYSMAELEDGLKDGRSHIKKIVPAPVRLLIPKFKYLVIDADEGVDLTISAMKNGAQIPDLDVIKVEGQRAIEFAQLQRLGADSLKITGGEFTLGPAPSPDDMKHRDSEDE